MNLRVPLLACALLWGQMPWAQAAPVMPTQTAVSPQAAASSQIAAEHAHAIPCHGGAHEASLADVAGDIAADASAAAADAPAPAREHDCCADPACEKAGCHCLCSTALVVEDVSPRSVLALWTVRHVVAALLPVPSARPPDLFRPPI